MSRRNRGRHGLILLGAVAAILCGAPSWAADRDRPSRQLAELIDAHRAWMLRTNPLLATALGDHRYDRLLPDISLAEQDRQAVEAQGFIDRLDVIPDAGLTPSERANGAVLRRMLVEQVEGNHYPERMMLFTTYESWHQRFAAIGDDIAFRSAEDYRAYLDRLAAYPAYNRTAIDITRKAIAAGVVQPCAVLGDFERSISGLIVSDPALSRNYAPFLGQRPADIDAQGWAALQQRARRIILDQLNPAHRAFLDFYRSDYLPHCRLSVSAADLPDGKAYYAFRVAAHTTTDLSPEQIHQIGLDEVRRIRAEMEQVARAAGYASREAFIARLRSDPSYYATTAEGLMQAAALEAKRIDGKMPLLFTRLPSLPYGIRAIPPETAEGTTSAYYGPGNPAAGIAGTFYINTSKLAQRPLWELTALTLHEAVPGHHHQIALQQQLDLPDFRKYSAGFTAFTEGWALYAERLGIDLGLYDTPEKTMGRLSLEMWRACRLVVDTGLHAKGWSKAQAVAYLKDNSALTDANIEAEVNRYISWPGQALGYKLGELRIRALRAKAEAALGAKFDQRRFHDAVLAQGSIPLDLLERQVDAWIATEAER